MKKTITKIVSTVLTVCLLASPAFAYTLDIDAEPQAKLGEALYMEKAPVIDGYYSAAEWGEGMTFSFSADDTADDNVSVSYYNSGSLAALSGWKADICLRWDENYLYAAVLTNDPDVHAQGFFDGNIIRNDSVEMLIDPDGYVDYSTIGATDIAAAYCVSAGNSTLCNIKTDKNIISDTKEKSAPAKVCVAPAGSSYTDDTENGISTYEMAIPWETVFAGRLFNMGNTITALTYTEYKGRRSDPTSGIGRSFGFSANIFNAKKSGFVDRDEMHFGVPGELSLIVENALYLSGEKAVQEDSFKTFDPADIKITSDYTNTIDEPGVYYDYLSGDIDETSPVPYDFITTLTYDDVEDAYKWGIDTMLSADDVAKEIIRYEDRTHNFVLAPNSGEKWFFSAMTSGLTEDSAKYPMSYTFEADLKYESGKDYFGNTFGGAFGLDFICGYFPEAGQFRLMKKGLPGNDRVFAFYEKELTEGNWYHWKFQYDNITKAVRLFVCDGECEELIFDISGRDEFVSAENFGAVSFMTGTDDIRFDNVKLYNFAEESEPLPEQKSIKPGDVNCDKKINAVDALIEKYAILDIKSENLLSRQAADLNFDEKINAVDSNLQRRIIVGLD